MTTDPYKHLKLDIPDRGPDRVFHVTLWQRKDVEVYTDLPARAEAQGNDLERDGKFRSTEWEWDPAATKAVAEPTGEEVYAAYREAVGGKTFDGKPMLDYGDMPERVRAGWDAAARARRRV